MKRIVSVWLPSFATDRLHQLWRTATGAPSEAGPLSGRTALATVAAGKSGLRIVALDAAARALGMRPGMSLADARALSPTLAAVPADPPAERRELSALADWCCRYTPWVAIDKDASHPGKFGGGAGVWLDTSGCAHLFGGEEALLSDLLARLEGIGFAATAAIAETAGAAWAIARFGGERLTVLPEGSVAAALAPLSVRGLRLPLEVATALQRMGLRRIGDLLPLPRASLAARFDDLLLRRLDQALGRMDEPLCPRRPAPAFRARLAFAEPIERAEDMSLALRYLLVDLCARLEAAHKGARRLELAAFRADGKVERAAVGTSRPTRTPDHLQRLFGEKLERLDPGFGIEVMTLGALVVDPLVPTQAAIALADDAVKAESLVQLVDRLGNRLGPDAVVRLAGHPSHVPERACREVPAMSDLSSPHPLTLTLSRMRERESHSPSPQPSPDGRGRCVGDPLPTGEGSEHSERVRAVGSTAYEYPSAADASEDHGSRQPRPVNLLASPELIEVIAPVPDGPPVLFRWRRTRYLIARSEGPERIGPEWWLTHGGHGAEQLSRIRDYYRVEDNDGLRFWIYREGFYRPDRPPRWYLHGMFG